jgi:hypothetical protein
VRDGTFGFASEKSAQVIEIEHIFGVDEGGPLIMEHG